MCAHANGYLKCPDSSYAVEILLTVISLTATAEGLEPCIEIIELISSPVKSNFKAAHHALLQVKQI